MEWVGETQQSFSVSLRITALDRSGLLHDITSLLSHEKLNVEQVSTTHDNNGQVFVSLSVSVRHQEDVQRLIGKIQQVSHVVNVQRNTH